MCLCLICSHEAFAQIKQKKAEPVKQQTAPIKTKPAKKEPVAEKKIDPDQKEIVDQESIIKLQMAEDEYRAMNYSKALLYLNLITDKKAKAKVSYLSAKCYEGLIGRPLNQPDSIYTCCLNQITNYIKLGKDEVKKVELMKLKIKLENSEEYKTIKEFENMTPENALSMIKQIMKDNPPEKQDHFNPPVYSFSINDKCQLEIVRIFQYPNDILFLLLSVNLLDAYMDGSSIKTKSKNSFELYEGRSQNIQNFEKELASFKSRNSTLKFGYVPSANRYKNSPDLYFGIEKSEYNNSSTYKVFLNDETDLKSSFHLTDLCDWKVNMELRERMIKCFEILIKGCKNN